MTTTDRFSMPLREAMMTQRSIRRVTDEPVEDALLLQILELGTQAPNSRNEQSWEFMIIRDPAIKQQLAEQNRFMWRIARGGEQRRAKKRPDVAKINRAVQWSVDHFEDYPAMVVACYRGSRWQLPTILAASTYGSLLPAVQNIMLASRAAGLGVNLTTMPLWNNRKSRRILQLPRQLTPVVLLTFGWPKGGYGPTNRKPVGDVVSLDRYGHRPWQGQRAGDTADDRVVSLR